MNIVSISLNQKLDKRYHVACKYILFVVAFIATTFILMSVFDVR